MVDPGLQNFARTPPSPPLPELADVTRGLIKSTGYKQESPARSVSFGYSQDNANKQPTNEQYYASLEAKWRFAWVMSLISTNQTTYESYV